MQSEWLTAVMKAITLLGEDGIFIICVCAALLLFRKTRRLGIICSLSLILTFICCNGILKPLIDRERPFEYFNGIIQMLPHPGDASHPSGHTANFMGPVFAAFLASAPGTECLGWRGEGVPRETVRRLSIFGIVMAFMVGLSRIYLGMHYPTDVIGALILGALCALLVCSLVRIYESKHGVIGDA